MVNRPIAPTSELDGSIQISPETYLGTDRLAYAVPAPYREGKRTSGLKMAIAGPLAFVRSFILKGGFRDGRAGLTIAKLAAHHASLKHSLLYELQNQTSESRL